MMNVEENRLLTFSTWPDNAPVHPRQLAKSGFFATGNFLEAECFWCHCRISNWQYGEQVEERHRLMKPLCNFLVNNADCGNVADQNDFQQTTLSSNVVASVPTTTCTTDLGDLLIEANRLATYKNWPNPNISPQSLAKAGFYYLNRSDEVKCAWCKGVIAKWEKQDNAFDEHKRFFPNCPRVQLGPLIEIASNGIQSLGIQHNSPPKRPKYCSLDSRLRTYTNWPIGNIQRPEDLAQAGLFYQNVDDQVRCFHCNIGLRSWQKEDDPWFEHAKWCPQCQFVRLAKGAYYVQQVQELTRQSPQPVQQPTAPTCPPPTIDEAMSSPPVLQALEIGIDAGSIRIVTQRRLLSCGQPFSTVEELVRAVFDDREDDDSASNHEDTPNNDHVGSSILREVSRMFNDIFNASDEENVAGNATGPGTIHSILPRHFPPAMPTCASVKSDMPAACSVNSQNSISSNETKKVPAEAQPTTSPPSPTRSLSLEEENRQLRDARLCKVCLDEEVGVVFLPCGHLVTCVQCAPGVIHCPMCRTDIKGFVRTYLS